MQIIITKEKHGMHGFKAVRDDGSETYALLEDKSFLGHDFLHYSVESLAGLKNSFYGTVASGKNLEDLIPKESDAPPVVYGGVEAQITEMVVGGLTGVVLQGKTDAGQLFSTFRGILESQGMIYPEYLTPDFVVQVNDKMRQLMGHFNSLALGESMTLDF